MTEATPKATPKATKGVEVECVRKFFIEDKDSETGTKQINPGEIVTISSSVAKRLQKAGAVMVAIND